jgi:hypothetical protein
VAETSSGNLSLDQDLSLENSQDDQH